MHDTDSTGRPSQRSELAAYYSEALADQASSGLSVSDYAERLGVTPSTLYAWRRRLSDDEGSRRLQDRDTGAATHGLVEVSVRQSALDAASDPLVVRLRSGHQLEVPDHFDDDALRRLIQVLESC